MQLKINFKALTLLTLFFWGSIDLLGQSAEEVLSFDAFIQIVKAEHPFLKQADLIVQNAKAGKTNALGGFDPLLELGSDRKSFDGKNYYTQSQAGIILPTWYGVEVYAGIQNNVGVNLNNEETKGQSTYLGVNLSLLKNLILDKRRAALKQARIMVTQSELERKNEVNDVLLEAHLAYWKWVEDYMVLHLVQDAMKVNANRFEFVKVSFEQGDRAGIDTIEALTQLLSFEQLAQEASLNLKESNLNLSTFLWKNNLPVYLTDLVIPDTTIFDKIDNQVALRSAEEWVNAYAINHPKLMVFDQKLRVLEIENKLKMQNLLPKLNVKYDFLRGGSNFPLDNIANNFFQDNYKFGISFTSPIIGRASIGELRSNKIKIQLTELDNYYTKLAIENKIRFQFSAVQNLKDQVTTYDGIYQRYKILLDAEMSKLALGESTLFLINSRENKWIESSRKLISLKSKYNQAISKLYWSSGRLE